MRAIKYKVVWVLLIIFVITGCASIEKAESLHRQGEKQAALEMAISLLEDDSTKAVSYTHLTLPTNREV